MGNTAFGRMGEDRACLYLEEKGMTLVTRNFRCKHGEIDLIMKDVVEVKTRRSRLYGEPIEAVTVYKQRHIRYTAEVFLVARHLHDVRIRFDVVEVMMAPGRAVRLRHTKNAF
ncbi:YraN family protein [Dialister invisus]